MKIKDFKGHKYQEKFEAKALTSLLMPGFKNIEASFKEIETSSDNPIIRVKFASFGNIDSDRDILVKGAFAKTISENGANSTTNRKIAFVWQHDMKNPLGKSILEEELNDGAYGNVRLSDFKAVPDAYRAYSQLKDGTLNQFSFGYNYIWDKVEYDEAQDAFIVKEVRMYEYSVVTAGANDMTEYIGILDSSADMKSYIKGLKEYQPEKFQEIKNYICEIDKTAEPPKTLTASWIASFATERLTQ